MRDREAEKSNGGALLQLLDLETKMRFFILCVE